MYTLFICLYIYICRRRQIVYNPTAPGKATRC